LLAVFNFHCAASIAEKMEIKCELHRRLAADLLQLSNPSRRPRAQLASVASSAACRCAVPEQVTVLPSRISMVLAVTAPSSGNASVSCRKIAQALGNESSNHGRTAGFAAATPSSSVTLADMRDHCERSRMQLDLLEQKQCAKQSPPRRRHRADVRNLPEEYFVANCSISVGFGGKNSNGGADPSTRAARLNAAETRLPAEAARQIHPA
jgi:hypothetical protein